MKKTHQREERYSLEQAQQAINDGQSQTQWEHLAQLTDDEIETRVDELEEGTPNWLQATTELPSPKQPISIRLDLDVLEWFRGQGTGYQSRINQVLRRYVDAQSKKR